MLRTVRGAAPADRSRRLPTQEAHPVAHAWNCSSLQQIVGGEEAAANTGRFSQPTQGVTLAQTAVATEKHIVAPGYITVRMP